MLLSENNVDQGVNSFRIISLSNSWKGVSVSASYLANNLEFFFIFCIHIDIDEVLLQHKYKGLGFIPLELCSFIILEKAL